MRYQLLKILVLAFLASCAPRADAMSAETKRAIENGLRAGKTLADFLKDGNFQESLVKLARNLAPFLGVFAPLAGVALAFIPTGDSAEMVYMKKQFNEVSNKLDIITSEFQEVKNAIDWSAVVVSYGTYERKIRAAEANLNRIYEVEGNARQHEKEYFIHQYDSDFDNSLQKLYDAIMENDHVFSKNILEAAVKQTKKHKRKVEQFSLGLVQLLIQAIKVKISYYGMKNWTSDHVTSEWTAKMDFLRTRLERISQELKNGYETQVKIDADDLILRHHGLENRDLVQKIYYFVEEKYDWRYWFVAVYNDDEYGTDEHAISLCGGDSLLHKHDKNIIISSQDKANSSSFNQTDAGNLLQRVEDDINGCKLKDPGDRASALVDDIDAKAGKSCVPYALRMAVKSDSGLWYISWQGHRAYKKIDNRKRCCWGGFWGKCKTTWRFSMIVFG